MFYYLDKCFGGIGISINLLMRPKHENNDMISLQERC